MKRIFTVLSAAVLLSTAAFAQRFDYYGTERIHGNRVESSLKVFFPVYIGCSPIDGSSHFGVEMAGVRFHAKASQVESSLGVRWDHMKYRYGNDSRLRADYLGVPLRFTYKAGRGRIFAGAAAQILTNTWNRDTVYPFRGSVEAGFAYGMLGVYANYCVTPVFFNAAPTPGAFTVGLIIGV